jgi:hypothetical protein
MIIEASIAIIAVSFVITTIFLSMCLLRIYKALSILPTKKTKSAQADVISEFINWSVASIDLYHQIKARVKEGKTKR